MLLQVILEGLGLGVLLVLILSLIHIFSLQERRLEA